PSPRSAPRPQHLTLAFARMMQVWVPLPPIDDSGGSVGSEPPSKPPSTPSARHDPFAQRCPPPHVSTMQRLAQPSLSPHFLPAHEGVQVPSPHRLAPPAPHVSPPAQGAQSRTPSHRSFSRPQ